MHKRKEGVEIVKGRICNISRACWLKCLFAPQDDAVARVASLERQLSELQEVHQKSEARLRDVTRTLSELEERKRYADDKLNKAVSQSSQQVWEGSTQPLLPSKVYGKQSIWSCIHSFLWIIFILIIFHLHITSVSWTWFMCYSFHAWVRLVNCSCNKC